MRLTTLVVKNLLRRPLRTGLTVCGVGLSVAAVVALVGLAFGFQKSFVELYRQRGVDLVVVRAGVAERMTSALVEDDVHRIRALQGVRAATPSLRDVVSFEHLDLFGVVVQGWPTDSFLFDNLTLVEGRRVEPGGEREVMLGTILADSLDKRVGDHLEIVEGEVFRVVGVYEGINVFDSAAMVVLLDDLQELMGRDQQVSEFAVMAADPTDRAALDRLREDIESLGGGLRAMPTEDYVTGTVQIRVARSLAWFTSAIAIAIGTLGVLNTMIMSVFERTREIGVLRAIGWTRQLVVRMILLESIVLSLAGAVAGTGVAALVTRLLSRLPSTSGVVDGRIAPVVIAQGFAIAFLVGLAGGAYPALRGARLLPTEALRHE